MDIPDFTEADLARVGLSTRLRDLSEAFRVAVAAEDGDPATADGASLSATLWSLIATGFPQLQEAIVAYGRSRGASWDDIAELTGLTSQEASERWSGSAPPHLPDPAAQAAALDAWYILHAQLEPLARVRDPFSRQLSDRTPRGRDCLICGKYEGRTVPAWAGFPVPPGGHLVDDGTWRVGHGPTPYWPAGTLLIESHRHFLDHAELDPGEAATLGPLIQRLTGPLKEATGASRIHVFSCMEGTEHFHQWMVPRIGEHGSGRSFISNPGYCTPAEAEEVVGRVRKALERTAEGW